MSTELQEESASESGTHRPIANRILGVYPQRQKGLFMQRIKVLGGRISWSQWRKIDQIAALYSPGFPLHITTRQDIELHNIVPDCLPAVQQGLSDVALTTFAAGGDSIRNMTVCAGCDTCPDGFDLIPLAQLVRQHLEQQPVIFNLPRKFKISFSGCQRACAKPWLNDLGFIAQRDGLFTVIGAGSLGPKPTLGIQLYEDLAAKDVLPLSVAAIEFFEQYGDRKNRRRARFRHVKEKLGNHAFQTELDGRFGRLKARQSWPEVLPASGNKNIKLLYRLQLPNGNINPKEAIELANIAEPRGAVVRINLEHGLELYGTESIPLTENLAALATNPTIVACPGTSVCPKALVNCWSTADEIRQALANQHPPEVGINISGCPNNCAHSTVADIGLVGMQRKQKGKPTECYCLFTGGGNGQNDKSAEQSDIVCAKDVPATLKRLLKRAKPDRQII